MPLTNQLNDPVMWVVAVRNKDGTTGRSMPVTARSPMGAATEALEILQIQPRIRNVEMIVYRSSLDGGDGTRFIVTISVDQR